eukprot:890853-Prorocentrum_minimum.AAC.2
MQTAAKGPDNRLYRWKADEGQEEVALDSEEARSRQHKALKRCLKRRPIPPDVRAWYANHHLGKQPFMLGIVFCT